MTQGSENGVVFGLPEKLPGSAVTVGMFDGVHLGHRALLAVLVSEARRVDAPAVVLTFDRHPLELLAPERAPRYINTTGQKIELLREGGADQVVVAGFDHALADLAPEEFVDEVLVARLSAVAVVVGMNFRFGRKRAGDTERLRTLGEERGFRVVDVEPVIVHGAPASSTRVRGAIERGDVAGAAQLLGRPFRMLGRVVPGLGVGKKIGFPTANIEVAPRQIVPRDGVYAVRATVAGEVLPAVCSIGTRPTLGLQERAIEIHLFGFQGNIYGEEVGIAFYSRLRDEARFDSLESLVAQISRDVEEARQRLLRV